jgi:shikimate 5-dehydrogenase
MYFIGVTTASSSIMRLFPRWAELLGLEAEIVGLDVPLGAPPQAYRQAVLQVAEDPKARGGLVTTHKVSVFTHAGDLFAQLDEWAELCGEVSCIAKRPDGLHGWAKDPITAWRSFVDCAGADYFARHPQAEVLCLGAGGSGTAFTSRLLTVAQPPAGIHLTNRSSERLEEVARIHRQIGLSCPVEYHQVHGAADTDRLLEQLPPRSVVVNATGMGKDRPGSPVSDGARFPEQALAWDFNYRGSLEFLQQARHQAEERRLQVEDGWRYFLHGWSDHIAEVFELEIDRARFEGLAAAAEALR